jgi:hypothetical protein
MNVDELKSYIADKYPIGPSTNCSCAVTGDKYVVIGSQYPGIPTVPGTIDECASGESAFDEETACYAALNSFQLYAEGRAGKVYYRHRPELEYDDRERRYKVYMRLVISNKPEIALACKRCTCGR